ncbi:MAG: alpha/beta fold hydrolase [Micropruina sp.]|uniref:alpha/beta hydrolase n=1 Tax=Micropruina sp. TaxID=2737536 RepID=UPI0039E6A6C1
MGTPGASPPGWYRRLTVAPPSTSSADPAADREAALVRFAELAAADEGIPDATRSRLLEPDGPAPVTIVIWHGFTNAPSQFVPVAESLRASGYRVLLPRMPHHGLPDRLTRDLAQLTEAELVAQVDTCIDIAAGLGDQVWVLGLSAGGTMAAWAAATRDEVSRAVLAAPLVAPKGFPMPLVRFCVKYPRVVPGRFYLWWDPRVKADLGHSPYAYPGFPLSGVVPFLHLSESLFDGSVPAGHRLDRVVLISNPGDLAVRQDAARAFTAEVFAGAAAYRGEARIDGDLHWMHDFVDPWSPGTGSTDQVVAILEAALGIGGPSAGGLLLPPLVEPD